MDNLNDIFVFFEVIVLEFEIVLISFYLDNNKNDEIDVIYMVGGCILVDRVEY